MTLILLSHGNYTKHLLKALRGEMANAQKLEQLLLKHDYKAEIFDILELFESPEDYFLLAKLNSELSHQGISIVEEISLPLKQKIIDFLERKNPEYLFLLSWEFSLGALFSLGLQKKWPIASKFYVHSENEIIHPSIYEPSTLLLTESLLALKKGVEMGIPPWKMVYLPHHAPQKFYEMQPVRDPSEETIVIGMVSRLILGKNCEFALDAAKKLYEEGKNIRFILKGALETYPADSNYHQTLHHLLQSYENESWFTWDQEETPPYDMGNVYASFDIFLHLSGREAGSNVVVEALSLGRPSLVLQATTNESLFDEGVQFIHSEMGPHGFSIPDHADLYQKLKAMIDDKKLRKEMSYKAKKMAIDRFSPHLTIERMPLILKALKSYHQNDDSVKNEIENLLERDLKLILRKKICVEAEARGTRCN